MSELRVALTDVPSDLNPYKSNTLHIHTVMWPIYEPLFDVGDDMGLYPCLAEDWSTQDGLAYKFVLRNAAFHQSSGQFNADAVIQNLEALRLVNRKDTSFRERILADLVKSVEKNSPTEVTIELNYPKPELLFLALMRGPQGAGTGPFFRDPDQSGYGLKKNLAYRQPVQLGQIKFVKPASPDPAKLIEELEQGRVHFVRDLDPESALKVLGKLRPKTPDEPQLRTRRVRPFGLHYLGFHLGSTLFGRQEVRQAVRAAIDFARVESETGLELARGPIPPGVEAYDPTLPSPNQYRADAGPDLKGAEIRLLFNENSYYGRELATCISRDLDKAGATITPQPQPSSSELLKEIKKRRDLKDRHDHYVFAYNWYSILPAAEIFLRPLFESEMLDNLTGYENSQVNSLLKDAQSPAMSPEDRIARYRDAQRKIVDEAPAIFLGHSRVRFSAYNAKVTGLKLNVQSFPVDRYLGVDVI
jgi:ABC-type transport system substrate-binding protein